MALLSEKTGISLGWAVALTLTLIGAVATIFSWRQEDRAVLSSFQATTDEKLNGIDGKIVGLGHRLDLFEQAVRTGSEDRFHRADMKLWLFKARLQYPNLPDVE
jgi:hypothetical protein